MTVGRPSDRRAGAVDGDRDGGPDVADEGAVGLGQGGEVDLEVIAELAGGAKGGAVDGDVEDGAVEADVVEPGAGRDVPQADHAGGEAEDEGAGGTIGAGGHG